MTAARLRARGGRGRSHLLMRHLLFGLGGPGSTAFAPVDLGRGSGLRHELTAIVLVDTSFAVSVDLALVVVIDSGTCSHVFVVGVVRAREFAVELKLCGSMLPFLSKIIFPGTVESLAHPYTCAFSCQNGSLPTITLCATGFL